MKKKLMTLCMGALILGGCASSPRNQAGEPDERFLYMLVGSYATPEEEGIKVYRFDTTNAQTEYVSGLRGISNPSYLVPNADGSRVYTVGEDEGLSSTAHALAFDRSQGTLTYLNDQPTQGGAPCYINLDPSGKFVLTANYFGGNVTLFALDKDGKLMDRTHLLSFSGQGPDEERQTKPYLHCVEFTPDHRYLLADDLGTDRIHVFPLRPAPVEGDAASLLDEERASDVTLEPGSGPRHLCFHPNGKFAYLINELSGQVTALSYENEQLQPIQYIAADTVGARGSADIHLSPDGRYLYASNRLQADGIAIFAVDPTAGTLARVGYQPTDPHPRNFILTPDGHYLLVACRDTDRIHVFERNADTGLLTPTGQIIQTPRPVCLKFIAY